MELKLSSILLAHILKEENFKGNCKCIENVHKDMEEAIFMSTQEVLLEKDAIVMVVLFLLKME